MKKSKRRVIEAPIVPVAPPAFDWRDVVAAVWVVGVTGAFLAVLWSAGVLAVLGQLLGALGS